MRIPSLLTMALLPAALIAQAPAPLTFSQRYKAESPAIEQLIKDFQPEEAYKKAQGLLPTAKPVFDKTDANKARLCSYQFSDLVRTYHLAAKAAIAAGYWEKGREYLIAGQEVAKENHEQTQAMLTPVMEQWAGPVEAAKKAMAEGEARFKELSAKQPLTPDEEQELKNFQVHQMNITNGNKITKIFSEDIKVTKNELDFFGPLITSASKNLQTEADEMDKELASPKFKGKKDAYLAALLNAGNLKAQPNKLAQMGLLYRLRVRAEGTPLVPKVDAVIEKVRLDEDPFPAPKPAAKAPKKKTK